jgi:hypothetical protein
VSWLDYITEILHPGSYGASAGLNEIEKAILESPITRRWVQKKSLERRGMTRIEEYDDHHIPGVLERILIKKDTGRTREVWAPTNEDYAQALYRIALANSLAEAIAHPNTHGFRIGRSYRTAIEDLLSHAKTPGVNAIMQIDIQDCFPTIPLTPPKEKFLRGRLANYVEMVQRRGAEAMRRKGVIGNGMPQGHPIAPAIATMAIDLLLKEIRERWDAAARIIAYADDISIVTKDLATATRVLEDIKQTFGRHGMAIHPDKTSITDPTKGQKMEILGHEVNWGLGQADPIIAPRPRAFARLTEKVATAIGAKEVRRIVDGWINAYSLSNDPELNRRVNDAVAKGLLLSSKSNNDHSALPRGFF